MVSVNCVSQLIMVEIFAHLTYKMLNKRAVG